MSLYGGPQLITVCELWIKFHHNDGKTETKVFSTDQGDYQILWDEVYAYNKKHDIKLYSIEHYNTSTYTDY